MCESQGQRPRQQQAAGGAEGRDARRSGAVRSKTRRRNRNGDPVAGPFRLSSELAQKFRTDMTSVPKDARIRTGEQHREKEELTGIYIFFGSK